MFDRLIESEPETADFKNRRSYFMASTVVVGILFLAAVVVSIYAKDFDLGNGSLEMTELIAPVEMAAEISKPEPERPRTDPARETSQLPIRKENMSSTSEPTIVPTTTSVARNTVMARPPGDFQIGKQDTDPIGPGRNTTGTATGIGGPNLPNAKADPESEPEPPPVRRDPPVTKPGPPKSIGVVNSRATSLPKPQYSAAAIAMHAQGRVDVQVVIDETGKVISASAVSGHPMLRTSAEQAGRNARFTPTLLSNVPIKVTGVITYNFTRL